jgi:hypothetical protein
MAGCGTALFVVNQKSQTIIQSAGLHHQKQPTTGDMQRASITLSLSLSLSLKIIALAISFISTDYWQD